jgi:hypothetical protein
MKSEELWLVLKAINVSHFGLVIHIKMDLKAKEKLWKLKYFTIANLQKNPLQETKILQDIITLYN